MRNGYKTEESRHERPVKKRVLGNKKIKIYRLISFLENNGPKRIALFRRLGRNYETILRYPMLTKKDTKICS